MLRLDAADAATFDDVAVAEAERFAAADAVLRTKLLSMLAYMFECRARFEDIAASTAVAHQTNEAIAKEVARCLSNLGLLCSSGGVQIFRTLVTNIYRGSDQDLDHTVRILIIFL